MVATVKSRSSIADLVALGQIDLADVDRIADVEPGEGDRGSRPGCWPRRRPARARGWTTLRTPPRLMPGESSSLSKRTGNVDVTWLCSPMRRKSTWIGRLVTGWNCTSLGKRAVRLAADVDHHDGVHEVAGRQHLGEELLLDVDRQRLFLVAVDHGGHPSVATQCTGGSLASPFARFSGQRQLFAHCSFSRYKSPATPPGMTMAGEARAYREEAAFGKEGARRVVSQFQISRG